MKVKKIRIPGRVPQGPEKKDQQRIRTETRYEDEGHLFVVMLQGKMPLHKTDLVAGLKQITEHIQRLLQQEQAAEAAIVDRRQATGLVGPDGAPVSSGEKPKLGLV